MPLSDEDFAEVYAPGLSELRGITREEAYRRSLQIARTIREAVTSHVGLTYNELRALGR